jgi:hypothetical protein
MQYSRRGLLCKRPVAADEFNPDVIRHVDFAIFVRLEAQSFEDLMA